MRAPRVTPSSPTFHGNGSLPPVIAGLLASLPPVSKGWTKEEREKFVSTFGTVLDFAIPIREKSDLDHSEQE